MLALHFYFLFSPPCNELGSVPAGWLPWSGAVWEKGRLAWLSRGALLAKKGQRAHSSWLNEAVTCPHFGKLGLHLVLKQPIALAEFTYNSPAQLLKMSDELLKRSPQGTILPKDGRTYWSVEWWGNYPENNKESVSIWYTVWLHNFQTTTLKIYVFAIWFML